MPIHDWTRVDAGLFHAFHQDWIGVMARALNKGVLPSSYFALREQSTGGPVPDVLTLQLPSIPDEPTSAGAGLALAILPPRTRVVRRAEGTIYVRKADRIAIRHRLGQVVAMIEIVSPGNKGSKNEIRAFVDKTSKLIAQGIHLLVVDLFPPSKRDPQGLHKAIWDEFIEEDFELPADQPLSLASYSAGPPPEAYVETVGVGDTLPEMPIFLKSDLYVPAPLESTYRMTWDEFVPAPMQRLLEASAKDSHEA